MKNKFEIVSEDDLSYVLWQFGRNAELFVQLNPLATLMSFTLGIVAFHWLLVRRYPISMLTWRKLDYVWLSMAIIGVTGQVNANSDYFERTRLSIKLRDATAALGVFRHNLNQGAQVLCPGTMGPTRDQIFGAEHLIRGFSGDVEGYCLALTVAMHMSANERLDPQLHRVSPALVDQFSILNERFAGAVTESEENAYGSIATAFESYQRAIQQVWPLVLKDAEYNHYSLLARLLSPHLIAIALALRMTRVSAEIIEERSRSLPSS